MHPEYEHNTQSFTLTIFTSKTIAKITFNIQFSMLRSRLICLTKYSIVCIINKMFFF